MYCLIIIYVLTANKQVYSVTIVTSFVASSHTQNIKPKYFMQIIQFAEVLRFMFSKYYHMSGNLRKLHIYKRFK